MTARVTQQVIFAGYKTSPTVRCTALAIEVIRSNSSASDDVKQTQVIVVSQ